MTGTPNTPSAASPSVPAERVTTYGYTPGRALAVCGARVAVLVDLPPDAGLVAGLYELVRLPEAGLDEVLELLISPGLRAIQQFALAEPTDEGLRLVVRGGYNHSKNPISGDNVTFNIIAPGVITDHAVLASASPPFSLTSLSVMTAARWVTVTSVSLPAMPSEERPLAAWNRRTAATTLSL